LKTDPDSVGRDLLAYLTKHSKRMRRYAGFFEWPEKAVKEYGIACQLIESLRALGDESLCDPRPFGESQAPDIVCSGSHGERIALEISELVCEESVRLNAQGQDVIRSWEPTEVRQAVSERLASKDEKTYFGGPYDQIMVCLHTDETFLTHDWVQNALRGISFGPYRQLSRAFLLFSYCPGQQGYPVIELQLHTAGAGANPD
jgi:hypothetical protein